MYSFVALVACIGVTAASKCCIPPQWEATTNFLTSIVHNGKPVMAMGSAAMAYDAVNKIMGQYEFITIGARKQMTIGVLMDYKSNTKYTINDKGVCFKSTLNRDMAELNGCIPDNATVIGNDDSLGLEKDNVKIDWYRLELEGAAAFIAVTAENCVPVLETITGSLNGDSFFENVQYFNVTGGISNPTNLQVPPQGCENAQMFTDHYTGGNFMSNPLGRRSVLLGF